MTINGLEVTDVIIFPVKKKIKDNKLKAFAKIVLNDQMIINNIRIFEGIHGLFVKFPQEYNEKEQKGYDIVFPITAELRTYMMDQVLSQYSLCLSMMEG